MELVDHSFTFNAPTDTSRSRQGLSNEYLIAKIGFDTAEKFDGDRHNLPLSSSEFAAVSIGLSIL